MKERLVNIVEHFDIPLIMDPDVAIERAVAKVKEEAIEIESHRQSVMAAQQA